jgi:hypothetical protein
MGVARATPRGALPPLARMPDVLLAHFIYIYFVEKMYGKHVRKVRE